MSRTCPKCDTSWPDDVKECPHDGEPLPEAVDRDDSPGTGERPKRLEDCGCEAGDLLGPFRLQRVIGIGGMAAVFAAKHTILGHEVAVKVLNLELQHNPTEVERFFREARAITQIEHPSIVACLDYVDATDEEPAYLVMELAHGITLDRYIKENAPVPVAEAIGITSQICDAMAAVHGEGIIHRDLKPSNIVVLRSDDDWDGDVQVKLLDFGVAKFMITDEHFLRTRTGSVLGTPEYMAPEVIRGKKVGEYTDIYSLGAICYQLLTGRLPFVAESLGKLIQMQLREPAASPSAAAPEQSAKAIPAALDKLVLSCLAKNPEHRISGMAELRQRLSRATRTDDTDLVELPTDLPPLPQVKRRMTWAAVGIGVVALLGLSLWWTLGGKTAEKPAPPRTGPVTTTVPSPDVALRAEPPTGTDATTKQRQVRLVSRPKGAAVFRASDGRFLGSAPVELPIPEDGPVSYILRLDGHTDAQTTLTAGARSPVVVALNVAPAGPMTPGAMSTGPPVMRPDPMRQGPMGTGEWGTVDPFGGMRR